MRRLFVIPLVLIASVLVTPTAAYACDCAGTTDEEALQREDIAFIGTVEAVNGNEVAGLMGLKTVVRINVEQAIKGVVRRHTLVKTQPYGAACGIEFQLSERYVVYASDEGVGPPETNLCNGTRSVARAPVPAQLPGAAIIPGADRNWLWWVPYSAGLAIAALTTTTIVVLRRRRRRQT